MSIRSSIKPFIAKLKTVGRSSLLVTLAVALFVSPFTIFGAGIVAADSSTGDITGRVGAADTNDPLPNIYVQAFASHADYDNQITAATTTTDLNGSYDLTNLAPGSYILEFNNWGGNTNNPYATQYYHNQKFADNADAVPVAAGTTTSNIDEQLATAAHISGRVTDTNNNPLKDITIEAWDADTGNPTNQMMSGATTGDDGTFTVGGLPAGSYIIEFNDQGWGANKYYSTQYYDGAIGIDQATAVNVSAGQTQEINTAKLSPAGLVSGTVKDTNDRSVANLNVRAYKSVDDYNHNRTISWTQTQSDGTYLLGGLPDNADYYIAFDEQGGGDANYVTQYYHNQPTIDTATSVSTTVGQTTTDIDATMQIAGHIHGRITDENGNPVSDIRVDTSTCNDDFSDCEGTNTFASTDDNGYYTMGGLATGQYYVLFNQYGAGNNGYDQQFYNGAQSYRAATPVNVVSGVTTNSIDGQVTHAAHITGKVTDGSGTPIPNINVHVFASISDYQHYSNYEQGYNEFQTATTGDDGTYDIGILPAGSYYVEFNDGNDNNYNNSLYTQWWNGAPSIGTSTQVMVAAGETAKNIDAVFTAPGHITGKVTDINGNIVPTVIGGAGTPVSPITVKAFASAADYNDGLNAVNGVVANADGTYDLSGLPAGSYYLVFNDRGSMYYQNSYVTQFYNAKDGIESAEKVNVTSNGVTPGINAALPFNVTIAASTDPVTTNTPVTYTATMHNTPEAGTTVSFTDNGQPIPGGTDLTFVNGKVSVTTTYTSVGSHNIVASWSNTDDPWEQGNSAPFGETVIKAGTQLAGANLSGADLAGANLSGDSLVGTILKSADLIGANLTNTNLKGVNLKGANLSGANLTGANLKGANLNGAILTNVTWSNTILPDGMNSNTVTNGNYAVHF